MVGAPNGLLPGSKLSNREALPNGALRWTIRLVPGRQTCPQVVALVGNIASAFGRSLADVAVREDPSGAMDLATLTITPKRGNPLMRPIPHPGWGATWNPADGTVGVGRYADGDEGRWRLWVPDVGAYGGFVVGSTRTGKSVFLTLLGGEAQATGIVSVWPGCPIGGSSFPALLDGADWPARTPESMLTQARAANRLMDARGAMLSLHIQPLFVPGSNSGPMVLLIWDEIHRLFRDDWPGRAEIIKLAARIAQEGAKFGVALVASDQLPGADVFGMSEALRSNLFAAQIFALRTVSSSAGTIIPGVGVDLRLLPRQWPDGSGTQGLGVLAGGGVAAQLRAYLPDITPGFMAGMPHPLFSAVDLAAMGVLWADRHHQAHAEQVEAVGRHLACLPVDVVARMAAGDPRLAEVWAAWQARHGRTDAATVTVGDVWSLPPLQDLPEMPAPVRQAV